MEILKFLNNNTLFFPEGNISLSDYFNSTNQSDKHLDEYVVRQKVHASMYIYNSPTSIALNVLYIPLFLIAFCGNLLVLVVVLPSKHMRSITNYFLVNLAVADLLATLLCVPVAIGRSIYRIWIYGKFLCKFTNYMQGVAVSSSVFTIMSLSLDRYLAMKHPVLFRTVSAGKHATRLVLIIWIWSFFLMIPILFVMERIDYGFIPQEPVYFCHEVWNAPISRQIYDTILFLLMFVIPGIIITGSYSRIGCALWTEGNFMYRNDSDISNAQAQKVMLGRRKIAKMLAVVAIVFGICWMPHHCLSLYFAFLERTDALALEILPFTLLLGHLNSALNPILYCYLNRSFRNRTIRVLKKACCNCICRCHFNIKPKRGDTHVLRICQGKRRSPCEDLSTTNALRRHLVGKTSSSTRHSASGSQRPTSNTHLDNHTQQRTHTNGIKTIDHAVNMDFLKPIAPRKGRRKKTGSSKGHVNIPTTINEENSPMSSQLYSVCGDQLSHGCNDCCCSNYTPNVGENEYYGLSEEAERCLGQENSSNYVCNCKKGRYTGRTTAEESFYDDSQDSNDSSGSFCEVCADAGLVECCHLTPEPALRLALLRQLKAGSDTKSAKDDRKSASKLPKIQITVESYT